MADVLEQVHLKARNHNRAPIPWSVATSLDPHAGFSDTKGNTWSPMNTESHVCNIAQQDTDVDSVLNFRRKRISIRKTFVETLVFGDFKAVRETMNDGPIFAYWRRPMIAEEEKARGCEQDGERDVLIVLNLMERDGVEFLMPKVEKGETDYFGLDGTSEDAKQSRIASGQKLALSACEGIVFGHWCGDALIRERP